MKKLAVLFTLFFFLIGSSIIAQSGHYKNGKGSSHKGGTYKNSKTNCQESSRRFKSRGGRGDN